MSIRDVNAKELPTIGYHNELVLGGVLEYVFDIGKLVAALRRHCNIIIASYAVIERRTLRRILEARSHCRVNDLSTEDLLQVFQYTGFGGRRPQSLASTCDLQVR